jgi:hypothetical protein
MPPQTAYVPRVAYACCPLPCPPPPPPPLCVLQLCSPNPCEPFRFEIVKCPPPCCPCNPCAGSAPMPATSAPSNYVPYSQSSYPSRGGCGCGGR